MLNKVFLIGRLTGDVDLRYIGNGSPVGNFSIACNKKYKKKGSEDMQEKVFFGNCVVWGSQAENADKFLSKGSLAYVEGELETRSWEKEGVTQYKTEINVSNIIYLDQKKGAKNNETGGEDNGKDDLEPF